MNGYANWELVLSKEYPNIVVAFECDFVQEVYTRWHSSISILCMFQAVSPWFELRVGLLTGTTTKNVLRAVKYLLADDAEFGDTAKLLFDIFGFKMQRPSAAQVMSKQKAVVKKMYKQLGHTVERSTSLIFISA